MHLNYSNITPNRLLVSLANNLAWLMAVPISYKGCTAEDQVMGFETELTAFREMAHPTHEVQTTRAIVFNAIDGRVLPCGL